MNILVTGANGQLGNEMRIIASCHSERGEESDYYIFTDVCDASQESIDMLHQLAGEDVDFSTTQLDMTDINTIRQMVAAKNIDVIVNCAAYTNVDAAEDHYDQAELLNAIAPENLAIVMREVNGLLIHISSDYVFGKEQYNTPCREDMKGTPTGVYGLTKLHGEQAIQRVGCKYVIIRTAWLYSEFGKNFVKTVLNMLATKPQLKVVYDQVGTPTYAGDLAKVIYYIIKNRIFEYNTGVYHFSNEGVCSWFDFTKEIAWQVGNKCCDIQPCRSYEFPSPVHRPSYSVLDKTKIKNTFGIVIPYWIESLRICLKRMKVL